MEEVVGTDIPAGVADPVAPRTPLGEHPIRSGSAAPAPADADVEEHRVTGKGLDEPLIAHAFLHQSEPGGPSVELFGIPDRDLGPDPPEPPSSGYVPSALLRTIERSLDAIDGFDRPGPRDQAPRPDHVPAPRPDHVPAPRPDHVPRPRPPTTSPGPRLGPKVPPRGRRFTSRSGAEPSKNQEKYLMSDAPGSRTGVRAAPLRDGARTSSGRRSRSCRARVVLRLRSDRGIPQTDRRPLGDGPSCGGSAPRSRVGDRVLPDVGMSSMSPRRRVWLVNSLLIVLVGVLCTVLGAHSVSQADAQRSRQSATAATQEIAANLTLAVERQQDLAVNAGAFVVANPAATQQQFEQWTRSAQVFQRYPEVEGIAEVVLVTQAQLATFASAVDAAPAGLLPPGSSFAVVPPGTRPYYCFPARSQSRSGALETPADTDLCDSPIGAGLLDARGSGEGAYLPYGSGTGEAMVVGTPIYRPGADTSTARDRDGAFLGWTGTQFAPGVILRSALGGHADTAVVFHYSEGSESASFTAGTVPAGAHRTTVGLHNGWSVEVLSPPYPVGLLDNGSVLWLLVAGILLSLLLGALVYVLGTSRSRALALVDERTDELRHQALHDALTGLPNRALILDRIGQMLARSRRDLVPTTVLFLDLDNFKDINDTLGHRVGDDLLVAVGSRLTGALREGDSVGRLGGDEFVILTGSATSADGTGSVVDRIMSAMKEPFEIAGSDAPLSVSASIGIADGDRATPEELLQDADIALYQAKAEGKRRAVRFTQSMQAAVDDHRHLAVDLQTALRSGQFFLEYQPIVDLVSGSCTGVEALLRWHHPSRGTLGPDEFIDELESGGPIAEVGAWILDEACRQGARWQDDGHALAVSVNVSARQFEQERILDDVDAALAASGLEPDRLVLELTETVVMHDVEDAVRRLSLLKEQGVRVAIDDFGTGYSSLAYLRRLPLDVLKIDRSFVTAMGDSAETEALVHTLAQLAKSLGLATIAEGVESEEQRRRLRAEGVDAGQGFLFSAPLAPSDVDRLLRPSPRTGMVAVGTGG